MPRRPAEAVLDLGRRKRIGLDEAVFCAGKSPAQIASILTKHEAARTPALLTRLDAEKFENLPAALRARIDYESLSRTGILGVGPRKAGGWPLVAVVTAGTSDLGVAREAARTLGFHGIGVTEIADVGVAGLWRLMKRIDAIRRHRVVIVAAGMDAALPSVLGGLVGCPVIAVPTSVGYGVASGGTTALNAALASCAPGVVVVNIDNGYGAACAALRILNTKASGG
ncbi:MAG: nickel pincer cofactor biosynthesis protein LarB [Alphaproteobacteria bacterium]|nr:nickel pincer cofactor biosynthesis protein LarB [Alphaproteobacteria bacterium]